jgi:hypothetical protein
LAAVILRQQREHQVLVLWRQESDQPVHGHQDRDVVAQEVLLLVEELVGLGVVERRVWEGQHH